MDIAEDFQQTASTAVEAQPTDLLPDVKRVSIKDTKVMNGTNAFDGTIPLEDNPFFVLAEWVKGNNLPSFKTIFVGIAHTVSAILNFFLEYLLWNIIFTLAVVEAPQIVVPAPWTDKKSDDGDETPKVQQERSITKSLRTTVRHLCALGGVSALSRGMASQIAWGVAYVLIPAPAHFFWFLRTTDFSEGRQHQTVPDFPDSRLREDLNDLLMDTTWDIVANMLLCSWLAAWVHIVITQPTLRTWWRRLPPFMQVLRATWLPILLFSLVDTLFINALTISLTHYFGLEGPSEAADGLMTAHNSKKVLIWLVHRSLHALTTLTIDAALIRVQASLLPEEEETIIPFDRSFGLSGANGLRPGLLAESSGVLSFGDAWRSITWMEMRRLLIVSIKMLAVQAAVNAIFWPVLGNKAWPGAWLAFRME